MANEIPISALDWWQFNTEESGYWEKKNQHRSVSKSLVWELENLGCIPSPVTGLLSNLHQFLFSFFALTQFLYLGGRTELKRALLCLWAKTAPSADSTLSNVK